MLSYCFSEACRDTKSTACSQTTAQRGYRARQCSETSFDAFPQQRFRSPYYLHKVSLEFREMGARNDGSFCSAKRYTPSLLPRCHAGQLRCVVIHRFDTQKEQNARIYIKACYNEIEGSHKFSSFSCAWQVKADKYTIPRYLLHAYIPITNPQPVSPS